MTATATRPAPADAPEIEQPDHEIVIVGNGFSGLGTAIKLKQSGIDDFLIIDKADSVAGTWRENTYPGCACDVPSHMYSYSFEQNPDWTRMYAPQPEIRAYLERCVDKYGLRDHLVLNTKALGAEWDESAGLWRCRAEGPEGESAITARFLVSGIGGLHVPSAPDFPGIENFKGAVFHSAQWDHDYDLTGKRVAVIGTGASSIQFVPEIQPQVEQLDLYQRTAPWIMPKVDRGISRFERRLYRALPFLQRGIRYGIYWFLELVALRVVKSERIGRIAERIATRHLQKQVSDPVKRQKLTPNYEIGCKRILMSNTYYAALDQPNAAVITDGIAEIRAGSVVDGAGVEREVDAIILGTGFDTQAMASSVELRGVGGRLLAEEWTESGIQAHRGTMIAGFPNLFFLLGPNTGLGHNSVVFMIERQIGLALKAIKECRHRGPGVSLAPTATAQASFNQRVQDELRDAVWSRGTCQSWYLDSHGRNITLWPGATWQFRNELNSLKVDEYEFATPAHSPSSELIPAAVAA